jgi:hypothetical protein
MMMNAIIPLLVKANLLLLLLVDTVTSFAPIAFPFRPIRMIPTTMSLSSSSPQSSSSSDEDFARAFAQFEELDSLDDDTAAAVSFELNDIEMEQIIQAAISTTDDPSPEDEFKLYGNMYEELDQDTNDIFQDVMNQMGKEEDLIMMTATTENEDSMLPETPTIPIDDDVFVVAATDTTDSTNTITDDFLQQAWEEAMNEIQPRSEMTGEFKDSILKDTDLMKEIEAIFDRGNDQLLANLEEIRQEQVRCPYLTVLS